MEVILLEDVDKLGKAGDTVDVAPGYARNYLLVRKKALLSSPENVKRFEHIKKKREDEYLESKEEAEELASKLNDVSITAVVKASESEKLYGSVTPSHIVSLLKEEGYDIDKKKIVIEEPIKSLGVYNIGIKLHPEVQAKVKLWVVSESV
jgi:large subunit ribosomal protein L9